MGLIWRWLEWFAWSRAVASAGAALSGACVVTGAVQGQTLTVLAGAFGVVVWTHSFVERRAHVTAPVPPTDVQLVRGGESIPLDCIYAGRDADGTAVWNAIMSVAQCLDVEGGRAEVRIGALPAMTSIRIAPWEP